MESLAEFKEGLLAKHNELRSLHGAPPLEWSDELAAHAQLAADDNEKSGMRHIHAQEYGEGQNVSQLVYRLPHCVCV